MIIIEFIAFVALSIGAFLLMTNDVWNVNIKKLRTGAILTNVGIIVICMCMANTSILGGLYIFPIFSTVVLMVIELLIIRSMEY